MMLSARSKFVLLPLLLAGCGGHGGNGSSGGGSSAAPSIVSTDVKPFTFAGGETEIDKGDVASSNLGLMPAPTTVEIVIGVGMQSFSVNCYDSGNDSLVFTCQYASAKSTSGTFMLDGATGAYASLKSASGSFSYTGNPGEINVSTLRLDFKSVSTM